MRNVLFVFCEAKQRTSFPAYSTVHSSHLHEKWAILTKEPSFKKLVKRFLKYRLYIKHHFRYLPTTQSVAIKYMTDGLAFPVLTVFPGIAKKTPTTSFQLYSLLRRLWSFEEGPRSCGDEMHGVFSNLSSETSRGTLFFCVFIE